MLSKIMSLKLQKSMLYIVLQAPLLTIYIYTIAANCGNPPIMRSQAGSSS